MGNMLDFYTTGKGRDAKVNMDVIRLIDEVSSFPDRHGNASENIDHLFCAGYCYYFANMLKLAFGGRVVWVHDRGHIAWADCSPECSFEELQEATMYDITGVLYDYEMVWPIEYLGDIVVDYMHNGNVYHLNQNFKDWCDFCKVSECFAITFIWETIPVDELLKAYPEGLNCPETAYREWLKERDKYQEVLRSINSNGRLSVSRLPLHSGIEKLYSMFSESFDAHTYLRDRIGEKVSLLPTASVNDCKTPEDCDKLLELIRLYK